MEKIPSIKELRSICKTKRTGFYVPAIDYLAFFPGKIFLYLPFTPNQITLIWIFIKIIAALFLITGDYWVTLIALIIFQLATVLDVVDGIVARYRNKFSLNGLYIDYFGHYFCNSLLMLTLGIGTYVQTGKLYYITLSAIAVFSLLFSKALTINLAWYNKPSQRKEVDDILYKQNLSLKDEKNLLILTMFDFLRLDHPLNLMFFLVLLGYQEFMIWIYMVFLSLEMFRKLFLQYNRIYKHEKLKGVTTVNDKNLPS